MTAMFNPAEHTVFCRKYQQNLPRLSAPPFPNAKGEEIQNSVSAKAWGEWLNLQTMLINEKHLSMIDPAAKQYLNEQREKFLDNGDYERPAGYTPPAV